MKELYSTISVVKENKKKEIRIYKVKTEGYGIEIETEENGDVVVKRVENITVNEKSIDELLSLIVNETESFKFLDYYASDWSWKDKAIS